MQRTVIFVLSLYGMSLYLCSSLEAISVITWRVAIIGTAFRPLPVNTYQGEVNSRDVNTDLLELSTALETSPKKLDHGDSAVD